MTKGLEQFENRSDDWLAKERQEESRVSAWDFDEGRKVKEFHEKNCEARQIKETHEIIHARQNASRRIQVQNKSNTSGIVLLLFIIIGFNFIGAFFFEEELSLISPFIVFVFIMVVVSMIKSKGRKNK